MIYTTNIISIIFHFKHTSGPVVVTFLSEIRTFWLSGQTPPAPLWFYHGGNFETGSTHQHDIKYLSVPHPTYLQDTLDLM